MLDDTFSLIHSIGYYVEPTILQVSDPKDKIMQEVII